MSSVHDLPHLNSFMGALSVCNTMPLVVTSGISPNGVFETGRTFIGDFPADHKWVENPYFLIMADGCEPCFGLESVGDSFFNGSFLTQLHENLIVRSPDFETWFTRIIGTVKPTVTATIGSAGTRFSTTHRGGLSLWNDEGFGFKLTMGATVGGSIEPEITRMEEVKARKIIDKLTASGDLFLRYQTQAAEAFHVKFHEGHALAGLHFCIVCDLNRPPDSAFMRFDTIPNEHCRDTSEYYQHDYFRDIEPEILSYEPLEDGSIVLINAMPGGGDLAMSAQPNITSASLAFKHVKLVARRDGKTYEPSLRSWSPNRWGQMTVGISSREFGIDFQGPHYNAFTPNLMSPDLRPSQR